MYQTMSPENLGSSSIRKSNPLKSSKEDHNNCPENGRIPSISNGNITTTTTTTNSSSQQIHVQDYHQNNNLTHTTTNHTNNILNSAPNQTHESSPNRTQSLGGSGDMLLQWGQRKRSRCSRTDARSMPMPMSMSSEKHILPHPHPQPPLSNGGSRNVVGGTSSIKPKSNGLLYTKDSPGLLPIKNRNIPDQMGCSNSASPSRNGGGSGSGSRLVSRSSMGKPSPSRIDKNDKKISSSGSSLRKVKSDDSLRAQHTTAGGNIVNHVDSISAAAHPGIDQENGRGHGHGHMASARSPDKPHNGGELVEWPRIYLSLSRKEKEDDFFAMKGTKLPHRPKKRAKAVDRALQYCFPGLWLSDLTRARYEVRERKSTKKPKRKGLKGLENMESESE